ncbi:MAG: DUF4434 domain-containing protein [Clostridiales bacterium]|nr:DUF4434 domain-containing protein [Clostridiales bacterium]
MKRIEGTWFEFWHHNRPEGKYYNAACRSFTEAQWRALLQDIHTAGMDTLVLTASSMVYEDSAESYFPTDIYDNPPDMVCKNAMDVLMDEADRLGMRIFVSCGWYGVWTQTVNNMRSEEVTTRAFRAIDQLYARYGAHPSFYGWYLPDETGPYPAYPYFGDVFIDYVNRYAAHLRALDPSKLVLVAPYGTKYIKADDKFVDQLRRLDADIVAYQDEVGVRKSTPAETGAYYRALRAAHDKAGRSKIWADMEVFEFEGEVYRSALTPASMERIRAQLAAISPYVDKVLIYCYQCAFSRPGTIAPFRCEGAEKLYNDYLQYARNEADE